MTSSPPLRPGVRHVAPWSYRALCVATPRDVSLRVVYGASCRPPLGRTRIRTRTGKCQHPLFPVFRAALFQLSSFDDTCRSVLETQGVSRAPFRPEASVGAETGSHQAAGLRRERPPLLAAWCGPEGSPISSPISRPAGGSLTSRMIPAGRLGASEGSDSRRHIDSGRCNRPETVKPKRLNPASASRTIRAASPSSFDANASRS